MPRLMSVALTEQAVRERRKTVTRRLGWQWLPAGDRLTLCRKVQGRKLKDGSVEPLVRLADVEVVNVWREPLMFITADEVVREGFPDMAPREFVEFFCRNMGCAPNVTVTRIEWRYLDGEPS